MANIWDFIQVNPSERPKYTRFELAKLVKEERARRGCTIEEIASELNIDTNLWLSIENASRVFNVRIYKLISSFLSISMEEIMAKEVDNMQAISFRATETNPEIIEAIQLANSIFDEMIMQEKISIT